MSEPRTYPHGVPSWVDTEQPDPAAAREFYGGLLGWTFEDGWVAPAGDGPGRWHVTFSAADRDDAAASTEALGGRVLASEDTEWTRTALVRDPQGAELTLSQFTPPGER